MKISVLMQNLVLDTIRSESIALLTLLINLIVSFVEFNLLVELQNGNECEQK